MRHGCFGHTSSLDGVMKKTSDCECPPQTLAKVETSNTNSIEVAVIEVGKGVLGNIVTKNVGLPCD